MLVSLTIMSRPLFLVTLLLLMVLTSQLDWNQKIVNKVDARSFVVSQKLQYILDRQESVKEKTLQGQAYTPLESKDESLQMEAAHDPHGTFEAFGWSYRREI